MDILTGTVGVKKAYDTLIGGPPPGKSGRPGDLGEVVSLWKACQPKTRYLRIPWCAHEQRGEF